MELQMAGHGLVPAGHTAPSPPQVFNEASQLAGREMESVVVTVSYLLPILSLGLSLSRIEDFQELKITSLLDKVRDIWPRGPRLF